MPEGPSIVILKNDLQPFIGSKINGVRGNSKVGIEVLDGRTIIDVKSWGKHLLILLDNYLTIRIHFMLFGSCMIYARKDRPERLGMDTNAGEINFYACSVKFIEGNLDEKYDWTADVMSDNWDPNKAKKKLKQVPDALVCDTLLNQEIFAGVGNIIKNEVLFRTRVHPESLIGKISPRKINELIADARTYSFQFMDWKREYVLRKNWLAHTRKICVRCNIPLIKKHLGKTNRRSFYCSRCQKLYT